MGDLRSQVAGVQNGGAALCSARDQRTVRETLDMAIERIFDDAERKCRNAVVRLRDGVYEA